MSRRLDSQLPLTDRIVAHNRFSNKQILVVTSELKFYFVVELHDTLVHRGVFTVTAPQTLSDKDKAFIFEINAT